MRGTFHKGLTKELVESDGWIKGATIALWLKFKFESWGETRKIITTTIIQCNLGGVELKYLKIGIWDIIMISLSFNCEDNQATRLSFGTIITIDLTKSSTTETSTSLRSCANQILGQVNVQGQIPLAGVKIQVQRNMGVTNIIDDGCALAATTKSSSTHFIGFLVNVMKSLTYLHYNFFYNVEILEERLQKVLDNSCMLAWTKLFGQPLLANGYH